ncbi:MAG: polyphenol oxidase family protein [Microthrixaceae bacterium]
MITHHVDVGPARIRLAFTERADGDFAVPAVGAAEPEALRHRRAAVAAGRWAWLRQVHGSTVVRVGGGDPVAGAEGDALVSAEPGTPLAVQTADCVPILLWSTDAARSGGDRPVVAAVHAGWRGLYDGVVEATVAAMREEGARSIGAAIGPHILPGHYEFSAADLTTMALRFGPDVVASTHHGEPALDLAAATRTALRIERVTVDGLVDGPMAQLCTASTILGGAPRFYSWRARRDRERQCSVIWVESA